MSRTRNTRPIQIQISDDSPYWNFGGIWSGVKFLVNRKERSERRYAKRLLLNGEQPTPYRRRNSAKWEYY